MKWNKTITLIILLAAFTYMLEAEKRIFSTIKSFPIVQQGIDNISSNTTILQKTVQFPSFDPLLKSKKKDSL